MKEASGNDETGAPIHELPPAHSATRLIEDAILVIGNLTLRPFDNRACWNDVDLGLTLGEYNVVHLLASKAGQYRTYRAIYDRMHYEGFMAGSGTDGYRQNVRSVIKRIRNKCRAIDPTFDGIETYTGFGYRWKE